jgi:hypothetical protein
MLTGSLLYTIFEVQAWLFLVVSYFSLASLTQQQSKGTSIEFGSAVLNFAMIAIIGMVASMCFS